MNGLVSTALVTLLACSQAAASYLLDTSQACGEGTQHICYGAPDGTSQNVDPDDLSCLADSIRSNARDTTKSAFFNMPPSSAGDCQEWTIAAEGTVLVLAEHASAGLNTTVLYSDIASTIGGDETASANQVKSSILGYGNDGGQLGLIYDKNNTAYNSDAYKAWKASPSELVIKVVYSVQIHSS